MLEVPTLGYETVIFRCGTTMGLACCPHLVCASTILQCASWILIVTLSALLTPILILPLTRKIRRIRMFPLRRLHVNRRKMTPRVNIMNCCKQRRTRTNCFLWLLRVVASTFNSC